MCFCLSAAVAFWLPVFGGADERPHFAYAAAVLHGDLPTLDDRIPEEDRRFPVFGRWSDGLEETGGRARETIFVANHPPLFYVLAAGPLWLASMTGSDVVPSLTLRLLNAGFMALGVLLTGWLVREVFARSPRRDLLAGAASGVTAVTPNLVAVSAMGYSDGLGFALSAAALLVTVRLVRRGPDRDLVVIGAALGSACGLSRASLLPAVAMMAAAAAVGAWRHMAPNRRLTSALVAGGVITAAPAVTAGWFYARNQHLYGTPTGDRYNLWLLGRLSDERSTLDVLTSGHFHRDLWSGLYGTVNPHVEWVVVGLVAVGLVSRVATGLVERRGPRHAAAGGTVGWASWIIFAGYALTMLVGIADHVSQGGVAHARYLLPLVPLVGVLVAAAVDAFPRRPELVAAAIVTLTTVGTVWLLIRYTTLQTALEQSGQFALSESAASPVLSRLSWGLAAGAFVLVLRALLTSGRAPRTETAPADEHRVLSGSR